MEGSITVLRFEAEACRNAPALSAAVSRIYEEIRRGRRVLAIVRSRAGGSAEAVLLCEALESSGVPSMVLDSARQAANLPSAPEPGPVAVFLSAERSAAPFRPPRALAAAEAVRPRPLRVALLGLGTVGLGVYERIAVYPDRFMIAAVAVRDAGKPRPACIPASALTANPWNALECSPDVVVELMGGLDPAASLIEAALARGMDVVTANKEALALRWRRFHEAAAACGARLKYSASVGGAVPVLECIGRQPPGSIARVEGVVNGTCNFILDRLAEGMDFETAVRLAQERGFAEADPAKDVSGADSAHKLAIIARCAFGAELRVEEVRTAGIENLGPSRVRSCAARGTAIRLVACCGASGGRVRASVEPMELPLSHFLAGARDAENRVQIRLRDGRTIRLSGKGAGRLPASLAVLADLHDVYANRTHGMLRVRTIGMQAR